MPRQHLAWRLRVRLQAGRTIAQMMHPNLPAVLAGHDEDRRALHSLRSWPSDVQNQQAVSDASRFNVK